MRVCETNELMISAMLDGVADKREMLRTMDHLAACSGCRGFYQRSRALDKRLDEVRLDAGELPMPGDLWERIATEANLVEPARIRRLKTVARGALLAAAALVFAFTLPFWFGPASPEPQGFDGVEVVLESNRGTMTDRRFVMLAKELLESDRRYHQQLYRIMDDLRESWPELETDEEISEEEVSEEMRLPELPLSEIASRS